MPVAALLDKIVFVSSVQQGKSWAEGCEEKRGEQPGGVFDEKATMRMSCWLHHWLTCRCSRTIWYQSHLLSLAAVRNLIWIKQAWLDCRQCITCCLNAKQQVHTGHGVSV